ELRTPLTSLRGYAELYRQGALPDEPGVANAMRRIESEGARMARLVDDMLLLAQAGEATLLQQSTVDVPELLDEVVSGVVGKAGRAIEIGARPSVKVRADADRLVQALRNLLRNALAHADAKVVLAAEVSGAWLRFTVDDDGPGIPESERHRVFDRFHRLDPGRARADGGAGLGLAIVRAIAEAHGGRAWAGASALGGAQLVVELPLLDG
ncbi:MAG: sensor histidine kinase, partial [Solirubrobacteraceae bacterium]